MTLPTGAYMKSYQNIHIIGIGGISNSGIAEILYQQGHTVSGSDLQSNDTIDRLRKLGMKIYHGHQAEHQKDADLVMYSLAIQEDNPELIAAKARNIPVLSRAELLGKMLENYHQSIAISGAHGKTTTTAIVTHILSRNNQNPTSLTGGFLPHENTNVLIGSDEIIITEACEYKDSFLQFHPTIACILNIDEDHLDYFKDLNDIIDSFSIFASQVKDGGVLIINGDDYHSKRATKHLTHRKKPITYGLQQTNDYYAKNITYNQQGHPSFEIFSKEKSLGKVSLKICGEYNIYNALAAFVITHEFGLPIEQIINSLETFKNARRRFEQIGTFQNISIIDDYAHHPKEITSTIEAAKRISGHQRILVVFQPHTFSRTKYLMDHFATAFRGIDHLFVTDIYAAREVNTHEISSEDFANAVCLDDVPSTYSGSLEQSAKMILSYAQPGDLIITMGAGPVDRVARMIRDYLIIENESKLPKASK